MPYLVRYAGSRSGRFKPITRDRIIIELRPWVPPDEIGDAMQRIDKGLKVRTRAATYYYTEEQPLTEEQYTELPHEAVRTGSKLMGVPDRDARGRFRSRAEDRPLDHEPVRDYRKGPSQLPLFPRKRESRVGLGADTYQSAQGRQTPVSPDGAVSYIAAGVSLVIEWGVYILAIAAPITALVMIAL